MITINKYKGYEQQIEGDDITTHFKDDNGGSDVELMILKVGESIVFYMNDNDRCLDLEMELSKDNVRNMINVLNDLLK